MNSPVVQLRPRRGAPRPGWGDPLLLSAPASERSVRRRIGLVWGLVVLNAMTYYGSVFLPSAVGKGITQGALPAALIIALSVNRKFVIRPNLFLSLITLLVVEAVVTTLQPQHVGTIYRTFRFFEFVAVLWLITPWWGRRDLMLVRYHLTAVCVVLGSVLLGLLVMPGRALDEGRLGGALWGTPPTQVAHYAAIVFGMVLVLWLSGHLRGRTTLIMIGLTGLILLMTHTRTALLALAIAILVAGLSLITVKARALKFFTYAGVIGAVSILTLSSLITSFLVRGENAQELHDLTGRTQVWGPLLAFPRDKFQVILGSGLSNNSSPVNGLPIDSGWLASYQDQGIIGITICAIILIFLLVAAFFHPDRVQRALALFLVTYDIAASFTEVGLGEPGMYMLDLVLVASLVVYSPAKRAPP
jgi:hypothetical protein